MLASKTPLSSLCRIKVKSTLTRVSPQNHLVRNVSALSHDDTLRVPFHGKWGQPSVFPASGDLTRGMISRSFSLTTTSMAKALKPAVTDMRDTDIEIDPDEVEFVGRRLRRFQVRRRQIDRHEKVVDAEEIFGPSYDCTLYKNCL